MYAFIYRRKEFNVRYYLSDSKGKMKSINRSFPIYLNEIIRVDLGSFSYTNNLIEYGKWSLKSNYKTYLISFNGFVYILRAYKDHVSFRDVENRE